jgi:hypothetical protein
LFPAFLQAPLIGLSYNAIRKPHGGDCNLCNQSNPLAKPRLHLQVEVGDHAPAASNPYLSEIALDCWIVKLTSVLAGSSALYVLRHVVAA